MHQTTTAKVVFVSRFEFTDTATGRLVSGCKVTLLSSEPSATDNSKGHEILVLSAPYDLYQKFPHVPGDYQLTTSLKSTSKGTSAQILDAHPCK